MRNREERRRKKALVKKRLIDRAIKRYNLGSVTWRFDGISLALIDKSSELPRSGRHSIRHVLRNEGRSRSHRYRCGQTGCDWCADSLQYSCKRAQSAIDADWQNWLAGDYNEEI